MNDAALAIPNLLYRYADAIDAGDFAAAARLFRHGWVVVGGEQIAGEDALVALWRRWVRVDADGTPRTRHLVTNPIIDLDADGANATCRSQWTILQATDTLALQPIATGRYEDRFAFADNAWRFAERRYVAPDLIGRMDEHLNIPLQTGDA